MRKGDSKCVSKRHTAEDTVKPILYGHSFERPLVITVNIYKPTFNGIPCITRLLDIPFVRPPIIYVQFSVQFFVAVNDRFYCSSGTVPKYILKHHL